MAFKPNNHATGSLMKAGEYELVIIEAEQTYSPGGTECFKIHGVVRNDVEQEYQNKHIYDNLWLSERALPFSEQKMNGVNNALSLPEVEYPTYNEWGMQLRGRAIRAKISPSKAQEGYSQRDNVNYYMATRHPDLNHIFQATPTLSAPEKSDAAEDDVELPF